MAAVVGFVVGKELFDGDCLGLEAVEEFGEVGLQLDEAVGDGAAGAETYDAGFVERRRGGAGRRGIRDVKAGIAGEAEAGVDADDAHGGSLSRESREERGFVMKDGLKPLAVPTPPGRAAPLQIV